MKIVCFGELMLRLSPSGGMRIGQSGIFDAVYGGAEANCAVSAANYGCNVSYVSAFPDNPIGDAAISQLRAFGINTDSIKRAPGRMGIYFLESGADQRPAKVVYDRKYSLFSMSKSDFYDWDMIFFGADYFHFSGITPALSHDLAEICYDACQHAHKLGIKVSCDINYRSALWSVSDASETLSKLLDEVDICIANEHQAGKLFGVMGNDIFPNPVDDSDDTFINNHNRTMLAAKRMCERFDLELCAFTVRRTVSSSVNNFAAALYSKSSDKAYFSKVYNIKIIDRVGSGDAFSGGLLAGLTRGMNDCDALEFGVASAVLKHSITGDFNRVTTAEVDALIKNSLNGRIQR